MNVIKEITTSDAITERINKFGALKKAFLKNPWKRINQSDFELINSVTMRGMCYVKRKWS